MSDYKGDTPQGKVMLAVDPNRLITEPNNPYETLEAPDGILRVGIDAVAGTELVSPEIPVDISAQSVGDITVDIAAQSLGAVTVEGTVDVGNLPAIQTVTGIVDVGNFPATQNVNITGQSFTPLEVEGSLSVTEAAVSTATNPSVSVGATSTQVLASNLNRRGALITVPTTAASSVFFGIGEAATLSGHEVVPGGSLSVNGKLTVAINAIVATGTQAVKVTEFED